MANNDPFILETQLRLVGDVLGLDGVKRQLAGIAIPTAQVARAGGAAGPVAASPGIQQTTAALLQQTQAMHQATNAAQAFAASIQNATSVASSIPRTLNQGARSAQNFGDSIFLAAKRYSSFVLATAVAFKGMQVVGGGVNAVIEFDAAVTKFGQILDPTTAQLEKFKQTFIELSISTGTGADEIAKIGQFLASAGFDDLGTGASQGKKLTETLAELAKVPLLPAFESTEQAAQGLITVLHQFNDEGLTAADVMNKLNEVANKYAVTSADLIETVKRGGSAMHVLGVSFDDYLGLVTTVKEVTQESAASIGTSFRMIGPRIISKPTIDYLKSIGITTHDASNNMLGFVEMLGEIKKRFDVLGREEQIELATKLGGVRQIGRVLALLSNFERVGEIARDSKSSFNSVNQDVEKGLQTVSKQLDVMSNVAKKLAIDLGPTLFIPAIHGLIKLGETAVSVIDTIKPLLPMFSQILAVVTAIGAARVGSQLVPRIAGMLGGGLALSGGTATAGVAMGAAMAAARTPTVAGAGAGPGMGYGAATTTRMAAILGSPLLQQAVLALAGSFVNAGTSVDSFAHQMNTAIVLLVSASALLKKQSITGFFAGGGLLPSLGKIGGGVATGGLLAGAAAIYALMEQRNKLVEDTIGSAVDEIQSLKINERGVDVNESRRRLNMVRQSVYDVISTTMDQLDISRQPRGIGRVGTMLANGLDRFWGLFDKETVGLAITPGGGFEAKKVEDAAKRVMAKNKDLIVRDLAASEISITRGGGKIPDLRDMVAEVLGGEKQADLFIGLFGGLDKLKAAMDDVATSLAKQDAGEALRDQITKTTNALQNLIVPPQLTGELILLSKVVAATNADIATSMSTFEGLASSAGGGMARLAFRPAPADVQRALAGGELNQLFKTMNLPAVGDFGQSIQQISDIIDSFIISAGRQSKDLTAENLPELLDGFFRTQKMPKSVQDALRYTFDDIAAQFAEAGDGAAKFIDPDKLRQELDKRLKNIGFAAQDVVVKQMSEMLEGIFQQTQNNLERMSTILSAQMDVPMRAVTRMESLASALSRQGIAVPEQVTRLGRGGWIERSIDTTARMEGEGAYRELTGRRYGMGEMEESQRRIAAMRAGITPASLGIASMAGSESVNRQLIDNFVSLQKEVALAAERMRGLKDVSPGTIASFEDLRKRALLAGAALTEQQKNLELARKTELASEGMKFDTTMRFFDRAVQGDRAAREQLPQDVRYTLDTKGPEQARLRMEENRLAKEEEINAKYDTFLENFKQANADNLKNFDAATKLQSDASTLFRSAVDKFSESINHWADVLGPITPTAAQTSDENWRAFIAAGTVGVVQQAPAQPPPGPGPGYDRWLQNQPGSTTVTVPPYQPFISPLLPMVPPAVPSTMPEQPLIIPKSVDDLSATVSELSAAVKGLSERSGGAINVQGFDELSQAIDRAVATLASSVGGEQTTAAVDNSVLIEKLNALAVAMNAPGNLRVDTSSKVDIQIGGIDKEMQDSIAVFLKQIADRTTRVILARALKSLAEKTDADIQIALNDVSKEIGLV